MLRAARLAPASAAPNFNNKRIHLHWDNPFIGSNSYDTAGTDAAFTSHIVGGDGNHAGVSFTFKPASAG